MPPPPSNPRRAVSAARLEPVPDGPRRVSGEAIREGAVDTMLNGAGLLRDVWDDFRNSDRYFKYKAAVLVCWLFLTVTSIGVACPTSGFRTSSMGARLVIAGDANAPIYMVKNDGKEPWQDVTVIVNGTYRSTAAQIDVNNDVTLSPVVLYDDKGTRAPADLKISQIELQVGEDKTTLLEGGQPK